MSLPGARVLLAVILMGTPGPARAAGWTQDAGAHYVKLWDRTLVGTVGITAGDQSVSLPETYVDTSLHLYGEVGLLTGLTAVFFGNPVGWATYDGSRVTYVGPLGAGLRAGTARGDLRLAVEGHYAYAPGVGDDRLLIGEVDGERYTYRATVETHRVEGEFQLGYPLSFGWVAVSTGARWYSRHRFDPALVGSAQIGLLRLPFTADVHVGWHQPLGEIEYSNLSGASETRYIGLGITGSYALGGGWAVNLALEGAVAYVANASTPALLFGLEHSGPG